MGQAYVDLLENREEIMFQHQATPLPAIPSSASRSGASSWRCSTTSAG